MKTTILTAAIVVATALGINQTAAALPYKTGRTVNTTLNPVNKINKIEVHGNVELYVSDGCDDHIKIYNTDYKGAAMTADKNGVLRIASYTTKKLVVWVTASDLNNISVYDNSEVRSFGCLSSIDLDVNLYDNASARLTMEVFHINVMVNGHAKANLAGAANEVELKYDMTAFADTSGLASEHLGKTENPERIASKNL